MMISYKLEDCKEKKDLSRKGTCRYEIYFTTMQYAKYSNLDYNNAFIETKRGANFVRSRNDLLS